MKKNNKGFTLVELVAVVAIMLALATIATVAVTGTLKKSKGEISEIQYKMIEESAKAYYMENNGNGTINIRIEDLISNGYLEDSKELASIKNNAVKIDKTGAYISGDNKLKTAIFSNYPNIVSTGNGLYETVDDDGKTYYFRGNVNNYVEIDENGEKIKWRIVRINGDGSIRIQRNKDIGNYEYGPSYKFDDSNIKIILNNYMSNTLKNNSIFVSSKFCNGYFNSDQKNFKCDGENDIVINNKIGLTTATDILLCSSSINTNLRTMTRGSKDENLRYSSNASVSSESMQYTYPVTNLTPNVKITSGDGTSSKPWVIDIQQTS